MAAEILLMMALAGGAVAVGFLLAGRQRPPAAKPDVLRTLNHSNGWMRARLANAPVDLSRPFVTEADWRVLRHAAADNDRLYQEALGKLRQRYQFSHPMLLPQSLRRIMLKWHCSVRDAVIELAKYDMVPED